MYIVVYSIICAVFWLQSTHIALVVIGRVTACLENLEMSGNLTAVREMSGNLLKIREKILSGKRCLKLLIVSCIFASIQVFSTSTGMIWVTLNMPSAAE